MQEYTDSELIKFIRSGDRRAFSSFYQHYYRKLFVLVLFLTKSDELAEDITQESFARLWEKRECLDETQSLKGYLRRIARNMVFDHSRRRQLKSKYELSNLAAPADNSTTEHLQHKELQLVLTEALSQLPKEKQEIFKMSRFEDKTYAEIAEHLQTTPKAVERHMARSLVFIRKHLIKYAGLCIAAFLLWKR